MQHFSLNNQLNGPGTSSTCGKTPTTSGHVDETSRQLAELAAFRRMLQLSEGSFSLSFSVYNYRRLRDELIKELLSQYPDILIVHLPPGTRNVLSVVQNRLGDVVPQAIFVLDLEESLPTDSGEYEVLRTLNASRETWEQLCCPIVFWLAEHAAALLASQAIDFWRYRSHTFEFSAAPLDVGAWQSESFDGFDMLHGLPLLQKTFRRAELEQRIEQLGSPPPAEMLSHALRWMLELAELHRIFSDFERAEILLREVERLCEDRNGADHHILTTSLNNLAVLLQTANRWAEAESLTRRALAIDEAALGADDPRVARDLENLAQMLLDTNRVAEAEPLMRRALAIDEQAQGMSHPNVAVCLNNLALLLQATGRLSEAEQMLRRALDINEQEYGSEHPRVATCLNNLALLLQATNRLSEAEPALLRALAIYERAYGTEHPTVAVALNNLAQLLQATNRMAEAESMMHRALNIHQQCYGTQHINVATDLNNLAVLLQATNRPGEAEPLLRQALAIDEQAYGAEHPKVANCLGNLASFLQDLGRPEEAEPMIRRALAIDERTLDANHPDTAIRLNNLATLLLATGRLSEAEPMLRRAVAILRQFEKATGHEHPRMRATVENLRRLRTHLNPQPEEFDQRLPEA